MEIEIKNTGKGIFPENIDRVFERFYREDSSRTGESGGYGLGLAIAKSIVEKYDGKIYARSNLGVDTSFIVKLPEK
ncbi:ATP-binding protein [Brassicibacter mesophilus]|uniref:ATP-binding protein n=1 Tax=Brassicibacter mesophilus TaxID=745119 RepID=UPI003D2355BF